MYKQISSCILGVKTDIIVTTFVDKTFIIVSQFGKVGSLIQVSPDPYLPTVTEPTYTVRTILGKSDPLHHAIARRVAAGAPPDKPVLIALSLKDTSTETVKEVQHLLSMCSDR